MGRREKINNQHAEMNNTARQLQVARSDQLYAGGAPVGCFCPFQDGSRAKLDSITQQTRWSTAAIRRHQA